MSPESNEALHFHTKHAAPEATILFIGRSKNDALEGGGARNGLKVEGNKRESGALKLLYSKWRVERSWRTCRGFKSQSLFLLSSH